MRGKTTIFRLVSVNYPRIASFKFSELLFILLFFKAKFSKMALWETFKLQALFIFGSVIAVFVAFINLNKVDPSIMETKSIFYEPWLAPFFFLFRVLFSFLFTVWIASVFFKIGLQKKQNIIKGIYIINVLPGILQIFRIITNLYFDIPFLEKPGYGPFSGVYDAGYLRLMGFDFEPLGYAFTLTISCLFYYVYTKKYPLVGFICLLMTFGTASIAGTLISIFAVYLIPFLNNRVKFLFMVILTFLGIAVLDNYSDLIILIEFSSRSYSDRFITSVASLRMFYDFPFGVGLGNWAYFFNYYNPSEFLFPKLDSGDFQSNNDLLQFLSTGGFILGGAYLWIFFGLIKRSKQKIFIVIAMTWFFASLAGFIFFNPIISLIQGVIIGEFLVNKYGSGDLYKR